MEFTLKVFGPFLGSALIVPVLSNSVNGVVAVMSSALLNTACMLVAEGYKKSLADTYKIELPMFPWLWGVMGVFAVLMLVIGLYGRWRNRFRAFEVCNSSLAASLYLGNALKFENWVPVSGCVGLLLGGLLVAVGKRNLSATEAASLGLGIWASECVSEFCAGFNVGEEILGPRNVLWIGWIGIAWVICMLPWVWLMNGRKTDFFALEFAEVKEGREERKSLLKEDLELRF